MRHDSLAGNTIQYILEISFTWRLRSILRLHILSSTYLDIWIFINLLYFYKLAAVKPWLKHAERAMASSRWRWFRSILRIWNRPVGCWNMFYHLFNRYNQRIINFALIILLEVWDCGWWWCTLRHQRIEQMHVRTTLDVVGKQASPCPTLMITVL